MVSAPALGKVLHMKKRSPRFNTKINMVVTRDGDSTNYDFFTLNISLTGMLIASKNQELLTFKKGDSISIVIDPWHEMLSQSISCDVRVARVANGDSKGLQKYLSHMGESNDISTIIGVYFDFVLLHNIQTLESHLINPQVA